MSARNINDPPLGEISSSSLLGSEAMPPAEGDSASTTPSAAKAQLRKYFADHEDDVMDSESVHGWLIALGTTTRKGDICESAQALADYMTGVKGYTTGEDFTMATEGDIEEARTNAKLALTDVSIKTIARYMTATAQQQANEEAKGSPIRSETTTTTKTEEALVKIANSTAVKLPEFKVKYATVKTAMQYNKKYSQAKKNTWEPAGLFDAVTAIRKNAGKSKEDLQRIA